MPHSFQRYFLVIAILAFGTSVHAQVSPICEAKSATSAALNQHRFLCLCIAKYLQTNDWVIDKSISRFNYVFRSLTAMRASKN